MKITFEIDTENDAFEDGNLVYELDRIVTRTMLRIKSYETINEFIPDITIPCFDFYGNTVGTCKIEK